MKTVLVFDYGIDQRIATLKHSDAIQIRKEIRKDHIEWTDGEGNLLTDRRYIVITIPNGMSFNEKALKFNANERTFTGYRLQTVGRDTEILVYDELPFLWHVSKFEEAGLFRVTQRMIPNREEGELFPCYINPKGIWQVGYDIVCGLIQLPFERISRHQKGKVSQP